MLNDKQVSEPKSEISDAITDGFRKDRLEAIIAHVEAHPETWGFAEWVKKTDCGTVCCAWGRAPLLWPDDWKWDFMGESNEGCVESPTDVCPNSWLGITFDEWEALFVSADWRFGNARWPGMRVLTERSRASTWIAHARRFISWKEPGSQHTELSPAPSSPEPSTSTEGDSN